MNKDGFYHQPRWVNAIVIVASMPIILSQFAQPTGVSRFLIIIGGLSLFLFVGICNKLRSGAFFPRWVEAKNLAGRLDSEKTRRITEAELAILATEVAAYDEQPRSLQTLTPAVQHIADNLRITIRENWLQSDNSRSNEAVEFCSRTTIVRVEICDGKYYCSAYETTQHSERSEWTAEITSTLAWSIAGHPFDSKEFRRVYFSMPN